jgi:deaminated glutathione amidase
MRIALAQIQSGTDPDANLSVVEKYSLEAADAGASLVLFPEATMCRFGVPLGPVAQPLDGAWADGVRAVAQRAGITVIAGMFCPSGDGRVTNTLIAAGDGVDAHYDKIHLYDAFGFAESRTVAPGHEPTVISVPGERSDGGNHDVVQVGLTLCYDIRFPQLYTELATRGAQLITVHASWGTGPGKLDQWTLLARARAIDTTGIVAAVGQAYPGDDIAAVGPTGVGGSLVSSATGEVIAAAGAEEALVVTDIDLAAAAKARETIAVLRNRVEFTKAQSSS